MRKTYRTIFISDIHLGAKECKSDRLNTFLENNTCETLYLLGDVIDGWKVQQDKLRWRQSTTDVIHNILKHASDTRVVYIIGNHDAFLRPLVTNIQTKNIEFVYKTIHIGSDDKLYLVIHGEEFDSNNKLAPVIGYYGDKLYEFILTANTKIHWILRKFNIRFFTTSRNFIVNTKKSIDFVFHRNFKKNAIAHCEYLGYDGIICGHCHHPEIDKTNGIIYMNDGDWVESMTALVEHHDGRWEIISPQKVLYQKTNDINMDAYDEEDE